MSRNSPSGGSVFALGAVALAVVCCAGPALLAGGSIAVAGGLLGTPLLPALAMVVLLGAVLYTMSRLRSRPRRACDRREGRACSGRVLRGAVVDATETDRCPARSEDRP